MISYLIGKPISERDGLTILVNGVGYSVRVNEKVSSWVGQQTVIELFIYTHVREEALELYGFHDRADRELFLLLLSVSGVGPRTALAIVNFAPEQIMQAVQMGDVSLFSSVPRVGKKLAQKIIIELKSKLGSTHDLDLQPLSPQRQLVTDALKNLGFEDRAIHQALSTLDVENMEAATAIKLAIQQIGKKR